MKLGAPYKCDKCGRMLPSRQTCWYCQYETYTCHKCGNINWAGKVCAKCDGDKLELGAIAYNAYCEALNIHRKCFNDLPKEEQDAWERAGVAAYKYDA